MKRGADFADAGLVTAPAALALRMEAATDLMEQLQTLLDDDRVHPAAPVMLAGAALEEYLRGLAAARNVNPSKPGIDALANALGADDTLTEQQRKDITSWAGLRNHAAHGDFDKVSADAARPMAMGINLFLQQATAATSP